jgi:glycerol-3-phosphate dehydrogenase
MYDVAIIGAGIIGAAIARELSKYNINIVILEKENDVSNGTSKANSAIVHGGYDPKCETLMAKYNVRGNEMFEEICKELSVPYKKNGALVLAFEDEEVKILNSLLENGKRNGVKGLKIIDKAEILKIEKDINNDVKAALYSPTVGIVDPIELTIALVENAGENGAELKLNSKVTALKKYEDYFDIEINESKKILAKTIINAAGVYGDYINNMVSNNRKDIIPVKGQYYLMDKSEGAKVSHVIFQCPTKKGKGILVSPTVHGNLIVGPNAEDSNDREDVNTTIDAMKYIKSKANKSVVNLDFSKNIRNFAGIRSYLVDQEDFEIGEAKDVKGFVNCIGMKSPGLTSSLAIAEDMPDMLKKTGLKLTEKIDFKSERKKINFMSLSIEEKNELIKNNARYGRIICRCEGITEGEIVDSINRPAGATTIDGVKKRCRTGMGRCQGGFCTIKIHEILARELHTNMEDIVMDKLGSNIIV